MALTKVPSNLDATIATTQSASDNSTNVATTAYVTTAIANLVDGAPSTLNTLDEIAAALNDDAALNTTLTTSIATKLPLAGGTMTGALNMGSQNITNAGTINSGAITATGINSTAGTVQFTDGGATFDSSDSNGYPHFTQTNGSAQIGFSRTGNSAGTGYIGADSSFVLNVYDSSFGKKASIDTSGNVVFTGSLSSGEAVITSSSATTAFIVKTNHSGNPTALQIGGSGAINGISSSNQSFTVLNVAKDTGSNNSAYFHGNVKLGGNLTHASDLTLDAAGDIILDAGGGDILFKDDGTLVGTLGGFASNNMIIKSEYSNGDVIIQGNDGGSGITALTLDMSDAGYAYFNRGIDIKAADGKRLRFTDADGTFRGGIQAVEGGGQMIASTAQHDIAIRSQSNMLFSSGGNTERMRIASGGNIGINIPSSQGISTPAINFEAWDGDGVTKMGIGNNASYVQRYQTHATAPASLVIDKARGTQASPSKVLPGDDLGRIIFRGQTGSGLYEAASIQVEANVDNLVNNGHDIPSDLYFKTTRDGGAGPLERMRIDFDGGIWHTNGHYGKYSWTKGVVFSAGQTQNLYFHLGNGNVYGSVKVHLSGDYGNVNTNGAMENVWGWGYNSVNTSQYGGGGGGTATIREGSTQNVFSFGSMTKTNNTTVKIPITNGNSSYQIHTAVFVEIIGEIQGLKYVSIS